MATSTTCCPRARAGPGSRSRTWRARAWARHCSPRCCRPRCDRFHATIVPQFLANINTLIYRHTAVEQFATFFLARLDDASGRLAFTNAGHNPPLLFRAAGGRTRLERGGPVVGILEAASYEEDEVTLAPGDWLVLYTDGITEARDGRGDLFGEERLCALVESARADLPSQELSRRILEAVRRHAGDRDPADDMTLLTLRMLEPVHA